MNNRLSIVWSRWVLVAQVMQIAIVVAFPISAMVVGGPSGGKSTALPFWDGPAEFFSCGAQYGKGLLEPLTTAGRQLSGVWVEADEFFQNGLSELSGSGSTRGSQIVEPEEASGNTGQEESTHEVTDGHWWWQYEAIALAPILNNPNARFQPPLEAEARYERAL